MESEADMKFFLHARCLQEAVKNNDYGGIKTHMGLLLSARAFTKTCLDRSGFMETMEEILRADHGESIAVTALTLKAWMPEIAIPDRKNKALHPCSTSSNEVLKAINVPEDATKMGVDIQNYSPSVRNILEMKRTLPATLRKARTSTQNKMKSKFNIARNSTVGHHTKPIRKPEENDPTVRRKAKRTSIAMPPRRYD